MTVYGVDGVAAGVVRDIWIDRSEYLIRYLEVTIAPEKTVLLPMTMADVDQRRKAVKVHAVLGSQFAGVPALENPDRVTMDEEERVCAYYGGGLLYATPARSEPYL
jgi:photosynthetic reaction center H subunit